MLSYVFPSIYIPLPSHVCSRHALSLTDNFSGGKKFPEVKTRNEFDRKRILITGGAGWSPAPFLQVQDCISTSYTVPQ